MSFSFHYFFYCLALMFIVRLVTWLFSRSSSLLMPFRKLILRLQVHVWVHFSLFDLHYWLIDPIQPSCEKIKLWIECRPVIFLRVWKPIGKMRIYGGLCLHLVAGYQVSGSNLSGEIKEMPLSIILCASIYLVLDFLLRINPGHEHLLDLLWVISYDAYFATSYSRNPTPNGNMNNWYQEFKFHLFWRTNQIHMLGKFLFCVPNNDKFKLI